MSVDSFIVSSEYPAEKIVWTAEGTCDSSNPHWKNVLSGYVFEPIDDSLAIESVLVDGVWSNDNWNTQYPINTNSRIQGYTQTGGSWTADYDDLSAFVYAGGSQIFSYTVPYNCVALNATSDSGNLIKYRLWAYVEESDWNTYSATKTAETLSHSLQLDTRLAHLNMISEQIMSVPSGQTKTFVHNLGFRPYCKMWTRVGGYMAGNAWAKNDLHTIFEPTNPYNLNKITIDTQNITIYAEDAYGGDTQDFLIRIFNYAIPV